MGWSALEEERPYNKKMWKVFNSTTLQSKTRLLGKSKSFLKTTCQLLGRLRRPSSSNRGCHSHIYFNSYGYHDRHRHQGLEIQSGLSNIQVGDLLPYKEVEAKTAVVLPHDCQQQPLNMKIADDDRDYWQDHEAESYDDPLADDEDKTEHALFETPDSKTLLLYGLNAKSENFIRDFRERLNLERQRSIEEFYKMLNRGC